jgi:hypothetical protein
MKPWTRLAMARHGLRGRDIGLLAGIRKSGNTYLRFLLANYLAQCDEPGRAPLAYADVEALVGQTLGDEESRPDLATAPALARLGIKRFYYTHRPYAPAFDGWRIVHVFRNPLDHLVSTFFYKFAQRRTGAARHWSVDGYQGPRDLLFMLDAYFETYVSYKRADVLRIAYEDLLEEPQRQLERVLEAFGAPRPDTAALARAVLNSSRDVLRAIEERDGPIHAPPGFEGHFVRDGSIGQHRDHFDASDWTTLARVAEKHATSLDEFRFEPAAEGREH